MVQDITTLAALYKGWDTYQRHLIEAITPLTPEQLAFSIASNTHTVGQIAAHIAFGRSLWIHRVMCLGGPELAEIAQKNWQPIEYTSQATELVQALEATWQDLQHYLDIWTLEDLEESIFEVEYLGNSHKFSLRWIIWHMIEHDMRHGGEISFLLGAQGLAGIDLDDIDHENH